MNTIRANKLFRKLGWRRDLPDARDRVMSIIPSAELPEVVSLRQQMSAVENQGHLGSCTGNGIVGCVQWNMNKYSEFFLFLCAILATPVLCAVLVLGVVGILDVLKVSHMVR